MARPSSPAGTSSPAPAPAAPRLPAASFEGARVAGQDLVALSYTLATGLGIEIEDTDSTES